MRVPSVSSPWKLASTYCWIVPLAASAFHLHNHSTVASIRSPHSWTMKTTSSSSSSSSSSLSSNELHSTLPQKFKVLGVCGGIGSGKSSASKLLVSELGCLAHLDADSIAHSVYRPGSPAVRDIVAAFGKDVLVQEEKGTETIDRKKLGAIVFGDRQEMAKLERLVWPHVKLLLMERIQGVKLEWQEGRAPGTIPVVVLEAAVLLDAEWDDLLDGVWVVTAPRDVALQRLMETRGLSHEESQKRIDAQESRRGIGNLQEEVQNRIVTNVIDNHGSLEDLARALGVALRDPKSWK